MSSFSKILTNCIQECLEYFIFLLALWTERAYSFITLSKSFVTAWLLFFKLFWTYLWEMISHSYINMHFFTVCIVSCIYCPSRYTFKLIAINSLIYLLWKQNNRNIISYIFPIGFPIFTKLCFALDPLSTVIYNDINIYQISLHESLYVKSLLNFIYFSITCFSPPLA